MRLLAFNQRHIRGPKPPTPFSGPGFDAAMAAVGMLVLHANIHVHDRAPKNHLATTFSFIAGSLGYAVLMPFVNDFVGGYAISASESGRGKSGSSAGFANPPSPSKAVLLRDAASGQGGVDPSFVVATYASSVNTGGTARFGGSHRGDASQDLSSAGVQGDSTPTNSRNYDEGSNRDGSTPPDEDRPRRSSRLANGKKPSTEKPPLSKKQNRARGGPPPPPPPGAGTTLGIGDGSKGDNDHASTFSLGPLLLAAFILFVFRRAFNKNKKRLMVSRHTLPSNPMCAPSDISNTTTALDIVLSKSASEIIHAICGLVPKAYYSNIKPAAWRLSYRLGDAIRALSTTAHSVHPLNCGLPATELHFSRDSMITETCNGTYCGGLTLNMSMQQAVESVGRAAPANFDGVLRQTSRYLRRVLLYVSVVILTMFTRQLLWIILPFIENSYVEQPISDIPRPAPVIGSATLVATPFRHSPRNIRKKIPLPVGSGWVTIEVKNHRPSDHQHPPNVGSTEIKVDVIPESQSAIEVLEQIIPETTAVAEPENAAKLDKLIAVLAKLSLEEDDEVSGYPVFANESTQPHDSEVCIYPGFLADVDGQHEQVDDSNNFVHQCDSNANDNDKYNSGEFIYPAAVDVDSAEPVVSNDVFREVKDVNTDPDTDIFNVPARDIGTSIHAPQNSSSSNRVGDTGQSSVIDKGKKKADLDVEAEDQMNDGPNDVIVAVEENATAIDPTLPVFIALPGYRRHRIRPKQRRRAWLARQEAAEAAQTIA